MNPIVNPLVQTSRRVQYLFIALLLASFAVVQSARAVGPESNEGDLVGNMAEEDDAAADLGSITADAAMGEAANNPDVRTIPINSQTPVLSCSPEKVNMRGTLHLRFAFEALEIKGFATIGDPIFRPVNIKLEGFSATVEGKSIGRKYLPHNTNFGTFDVHTEELNGFGHGTCKIKFRVTGKPNSKGDPNPRKDFYFIVEYSVGYDYRINNGTRRVTELKPGKPVISCRP